MTSAHSDYIVNSASIAPNFACWKHETFTIHHLWEHSTLIVPEAGTYTKLSRHNF